MSFGRNLLGLFLSVSLAIVASAQDPAAKANDPEQALVDALSADKSFARGEYKHVRAAYSKYFEQKHADDIKTGFGDDFTAISAWLDANPEVKETLFTAIDPDSDAIVKVMDIFKELHKLGPDRIKANPNVAVAVAVCWDDTKGIYDYRGHQIRTRSTMPEGVDKVGAVENYEYLLKADGPMKATIQALPWEFLIHVINHRTPEDERGWAVKNYVKRRPGIGSSYKDIVYDMEMLRSEMSRGPGKGDCKLTGEPYTLESIKKRGGVCAMQADFASRVAKSLAVPAEYVRGEANSGGLHAWVMWVEVKAATKDKIDFALLSEGRYFGDQYYIGSLTDPKSGKTITDRDLERRLTFIGQAPQNARQADLLMRAYPMIRERKNLSTTQQFDYLRKVRDIFPSDERAWLTLAELTKDGKADAANAVRWADQALSIFAKFPDFSWQLADDLLTPVKDKLARARLFERLVTSYEGLGRPDLACEARIKLVEYQVETKDWKRAADGLAQTVRKFPSEGRYVPKMMAKLQEVCSEKEYRGGVDLLTKFYLEILPKIPKTRGDEISKFCVKMHEQAVEFLKANNKVKEAALVENQLVQLRGRKG